MQAREYLDRGELESISQLNVRVPASLHRAVKQTARRRGMYLESYVEHLLRLGLFRDGTSKAARERYRPGEAAKKVVA